MGRTRRKRTLAALAGTAVLAGPIFAACSSGPTYDQWAATDGAAGRINLDEVQDAFKKADNATDFEKRVNEIYEGDHIVLIRASQDGQNLTLDGFEDLDDNGVITDTTDDKLFSILKDTDNNHRLQGHGANGYYNSGFGGGNFLFTYMLISSLSPRGYYYQTPPGRAGTIRNTRTNYRNSSRYRSQVSKNSSYFRKTKSFEGSKYTNASRNLSSSRTSYLGNQKTTGNFSKSATGVRSSWGSAPGSSRVASSRGGSFRGGGGSHRIIGFTRASQRR